MLFFGSPPPPPPEPTWSIHPPSAGPYVTGLAFVIISQLVAIPLCILAFQFKKGPWFVQYAIGMATAVLPLYVQPWLADYFVEQGWSSRMDVLAGRFVGSTTYAFTAFRIFGAAAGGTPKGADADLSTWIAFSTAAVDPLFEKDGKPVRPKPGSLVSRVKVLLLRLCALCLVSSLSHPFDATPAKAYVTGQGSGDLALKAAFVFDSVFIQLMMVYLFLSLLMDVGAMLLVVQNFEVLQPFNNPMFATRSPRDFWGRRWNLQVSATLKCCVFHPMVHHLKQTKSVAALAVFIASGLFHEYQFLLSFPNYALGDISFFFGMQSVIAFAETIIMKGLGRTKGWVLEDVLPGAVKSFIILVIFCPAIPYFTNIWIREGMFEVMSLMAPQIVYK
jgi:hypothetical protein